jgi:hypothetical protein
MLDLKEPRLEDPFFYPHFLSGFRHTQCQSVDVSWPILSPTGNPIHLHNICQIFITKIDEKISLDQSTLNIRRYEEIHLKAIEEALVWSTYHKGSPTTPRSMDGLLALQRLIPTPITPSMASICFLRRPFIQRLDSGPSHFSGAIISELTLLVDPALQEDSQISGG